LCDSQITFRSIMRTVDAKKTVDGPRTSVKGKCNPNTTLGASLEHSRQLLQYLIM